jgi:alpha-glucosidase
LPFPPSADAATLRADRTSILWLYRELLAARHASVALHAGTWERRDAPDGVLDYVRRDGDDSRRVIANFGADPVEVDHAGWEVELATDGATAGPIDGESGRLLRPSR